MTRAIRARARSVTRVVPLLATLLLGCSGEASPTGFGEPIRVFIERRLTLLTTTFVVLLVGGFVVVRYLI